MKTKKEIIPTVINSTFFLTMKTKKEIKNIKISPESHDILKKYCDKRGIKIYKFLENLIIEKCKEKKDIYGED
jgi:hypothetical protein